MRVVQALPALHTDVDVCKFSLSPRRKRERGGKMRIITIDYIDVIASGRERMVKEKKGREEWMEESRH